MTALRKFLQLRKLILLWTCMAVLFSACENNIKIVNDLTEKEANEIVVFLSANDIPAEKEQAAAASGGGNKVVLFNIIVPASQKIEALALLNMNGLPRRQGQSLLNLFSKQGLVSSELEERIRYQYGLAEQLASTIRKIDGILDADVQLSIPAEKQLPGQKQTEPVTASIYIKHQGVLDNPNSHLITKIKRLVANSIPGLEFENVTVIGDRAVFSEMTSQKEALGPELVRVWSLEIEKKSVFYFQLIFISLLLSIITLLCFILWMFWKVSALLPKTGGLKSLFTLSPLELKEEGEEEEESEEGKEGEEKPAAEQAAPSEGKAPAAEATAEQAGEAPAEPPPGG